MYIENSANKPTPAIKKKQLGITGLRRKKLVKIKSNLIKSNLTVYLIVRYASLLHYFHRSNQNYQVTELG